jgi:hypothetical protein
VSGSVDTILSHIQASLDASMWQVLLLTGADMSFYVLLLLLQRAISHVWQPQVC